MSDSRPLWEHQVTAIQSVLESRERGIKSVCLTAPTGSGKSRTTLETAQRILSEAKRVALYTNRRLMIDQFSETFIAAGQYHGTRAARHAEEHEHPMQICSVQTEYARCIKRDRWKLHACRPGDLAIFDEGHTHVNDMAKAIRQRHIEGGATTLDITATPLGMDEVCEELIVSATVPQMIERGIIVPAHTYGPDEPDIRSFKEMRAKIQAGMATSQEDARKAIMAPGIMGRVHKWYRELNPEQKPALLFAPGVDESVWFAEQFTKAGIKAAHIDGDDIWVDGKLYRSSTKGRDEILAGSEAGDIKVITNRFVLREAADMPWIHHIIAATVFSDIGSYIQTGGRGCRRHEKSNKTHYTFQDHGGNWWRFGSLNADRKWKIEYTAQIMSAMHIENTRERKTPEPRRCPKCAAIMTQAECRCGYVFERTKTPRPVVSTDGELKMIVRDNFEPRRLSKAPNGPARWKSMYWRARSDKWDATFRQAIAKFAEENYWGWPHTDWPYMPVELEDTFRKVKDVPFSRLHGYCPDCEKVGCTCEQREKRKSLFR